MITSQASWQTIHTPGVQNPDASVAPHTMHLLHNIPYRVCNVDDRIPTAIIMSSQHSSNWAESQSDALQALFDTTLLLTCPLHTVVGSSALPQSCPCPHKSAQVPAYLQCITVCCCNAACEYLDRVPDLCGSMSNLGCSLNRRPGCSFDSN